MSGNGITRLDLTAAELRAAAGKSRDAKSARRMLALALVVEGVNWTRAAETCGVRRVRKLSGGQFPRRTDTAPMPKVWRGCLTAGKAGGFRVLCLPRGRTSGPLVEAGPDLEKDGVVRWRRQDLQRRIAAAFAVEVHERTVGDLPAGKARRPRAISSRRLPLCGVAFSVAVNRHAILTPYRHPILTPSAA